MNASTRAHIRGLMLGAALVMSVGALEGQEGGRVTPSPIVVLKPQVASITAPHQSATCEEDAALGRLDAMRRHTKQGRFVGGFALGITLGLIGTGIAWAVASSSYPQPWPVPREHDGIPVNENCYRRAYIDQARSTNVAGAIQGGLVGTAVSVAIILVAIGFTSS